MICPYIFKIVPPLLPQHIFRFGQLLHQARMISLTTTCTGNPTRQFSTEFSPERTTDRINGSCRRTAPLPHKHAFNIRGIDRDEFGIGFHISMLIERLSTGAVEIGFDGRQHDFDEIKKLIHSVCFSYFGCLSIVCIYSSQRANLQPYRTKKAEHSSRAYISVSYDLFRGKTPRYDASTRSTTGTMLLTRGMLAPFEKRQICARRTIFYGCTTWSSEICKQTNETLMGQPDVIILIRAVPH